MLDNTCKQLMETTKLRNMLAQWKQLRSATTKIQKHAQWKMLSKPLTCINIKIGIKIRQKASLIRNLLNIFVEADIVIIRQMACQTCKQGYH
jgi:hypothetical protein